MFDTTKENTSFEDWMMELDRLCVRKLGLATDDLPDMDYAGWHEDGASAEDMLEEIEDSLE